MCMERVILQNEQFDCLQKNRNTYIKLKNSSNKICVIVKVQMCGADKSKPAFQQLVTNYFTGREINQSHSVVSPEGPCLSWA